MENATDVNKRPTKHSFNGIQYLTKGQPTLVILDRAKQYFIAYAMDKGQRNQHLLYQFEFEDKTKNPFLIPQPVIIDGKPAGEDSAIGILNRNFNSRQIGVHLIHPNQERDSMQIALRDYFIRQYAKNSVITKAGLISLPLEQFQNADAFLLEFTANGIVLSRPGHEYALEKTQSFESQKTDNIVT